MWSQIKANLGDILTMLVIAALIAVTVTVMYLDSFRPVVFGVDHNGVKGK